MTGGPVTFNGGIVSNGRVKAASSNPFSLQTDGTKTPVSYGGPNSCVADGSGIGDTDIALTSNSTAGVAWPTGWDPATFTQASVPCDYYTPLSKVGTQWDPASTPGVTAGGAAQPAHASAALAASPSGATKAGTIVTLTASASGGFLNWRVGESITVAGVGVAGYNGNFTITTVVSSTQIKYTGNSTALAASGGGTVTNTSRLPTGTFCAMRPDGQTATSIRVNSSGTITVVAPDIAVTTNGARYNSNPAAPQHLLFFATGGSSLPTTEEDKITVGNQANFFDGVIYVPKAFFRLSNGGTSDSGNTSIVAWGVNLTGGNGLKFTGSYITVGGQPGYWEIVVVGTKLGLDE
jgi:hypothetical protein